jgi:hypothetical protein
MMNSPAAIAEMFQERENAQIISDNQALQAAEDAQAAEERYQAYEESLAIDAENYQREALSQIYGGENPMAYIAALQTMAGAVEDYHQPLSGYALSSDGQPRYGAQYSGYSPLRGNMGSFLDDLKATVSSAEDTASSISDIATSVENIVAPDDSTPAPAAAAPVKAVAKTAVATSGAFSKFLASKVGPIPTPLLVLAGIAGGFYLYKRR